MMDDSELVMDDELDAFNDETFGGEGGEYEWDGNEGMLEVDPQDFHVEELENPENLKSHVPLPQRDKEYFEYEDQDRTYMNVEESISRLVLDDDFDDIEKERDRFVKASHKSLMPPQVISRNLWMTEKDIATPLFSSSVWSMHPTEITSPKHQEPINVARASVPTVPSNQGSVLSQPTSRPPPGLVQKPPNMRTLEEIEQELLTSSVKPVTTPDITRNIPSSVARRLIDIENVPKDYNENRRDAFPPQFFNQQAPMRPPQTIVPGLGRGGPGLLGQPPQGAHMFQFDMRQQLPNMRPGIHGPFPQGMPAAAYRQQHARFRGNFDIIRNQRSGQGAFLQQYARVRQSLQENANKLTFNGNGERSDKVMNEKDKQRLRNIQMLQLQNDHPYTTDFYYQMKKVKDTKDLKYLAKVFPLTADLPYRTPYEPTRFENALGKLQAVSALAPKKIIDTFIRVHCSSSHIGSAQAKTLMKIESVYRLYLELREYKFRKEVGTLDRGYDMKEEFMHYSRILMALDKTGGDFGPWMSFRKGRSLLLKLVLEFIHFSKGQPAAKMILMNMMKVVVNKANKKKPNEVLDLSTILKELVKQTDVVLNDQLIQQLLNLLDRH